MRYRIRRLNDTAEILEREMSEMLYISGSSGAQFDERAQALRRADDVIAAVAAASSSA